MRMMRYIKILIFSVFFLTQFVPEGHSQILRRAANRLGQKVVEKKVEREIEKKTDALADSIVNAMERDKRSPEEKARSAENRRKTGGLLGRMVGGMNQAVLPASYEFEQRMVLEIEDYDGNTTEMTMYHTSKAPIIGYEGGSPEMEQMAFAVMDFEEEYLATFTENEGEKMVISMPLPMDLILEMAEDQETSENYGIEKTGNTKTINGYRCEEYIIKDDHIVQHIWTTRDVKMSSNYYSVMKNMAQSNKKLGEIPDQWPEGVPMEIEIVDTKKNRFSYMRTKEFGPVDFIFPASEYSYMSFGE